MWLAEVAGQRILIDPLLEDTHHCGLFEVQPPRTVDAEALQPDLIVVSHRLSTVSACDRILVLDEGRCADFGPREAVAESSAFSQLMGAGA